MHQAANGIVSHEQAPELLFHQFRRLATQYNLSTPQMRLEFVQGGLYLPALVIECRQFCGGGLFRVQDGSDQPVQELRVFDILQAIVPPRNSVGAGFGTDSVRTVIREAVCAEPCLPIHRVVWAEEPKLRGGC